MNESFIIEALTLAQANIDNKKGGPFAAVIVKDNQIIARAANTVTTTNDPTAHAEVNAIREACKILNTFDLSGCEIYCSCEPCPMCLGAIYWAHINQIYFAADKVDAQQAGFDDSFIYDELEQPVSERKIKTIQILPEKGKVVLQNWKDNPDKVEY